MRKLFTLLLLLLLHQLLYAQENKILTGEGDNLLKVKKFAQGTAYTAIAVDDSGNVWAGTNKKGLFRAAYGSDTNSSFQLVPSATENDLTKMNITSIAADRLNNVWVGHAGNLTDNSAPGGGLKKININNLAIKGYSSDRNAECLEFYQKDGLATFNISGIAVDKYNTVWTSHRAQHLFVSGNVTSIWDNISLLTGVPAVVTILGGASSILTPGSLSFKRAQSELFYAKSTWKDYRDNNESPELPYPAYTCNANATVTPGSRRCEAIACSNTETWVSVFPLEYTLARKSPGKLAETQSFPSRILRYDLNGIFLGQLTFDSLGATQGGIFNSIYLTEKGDAWVSMTAGKGFAVKIKGCWTLLNSKNLPTLFPSGTYVNANAIWGNKSAVNGQVFIGTNNGLLVYNGVGKVDDESSYSLLTVGTAGLVSNNITGGASQKDSVQWVATDAGIMRIKSRNDFSVSENYTVCEDDDINKIEAQSTNDSHQKFDYHSYKVETTICKQDGPNGKNCNAKYVYDLMKMDVTLQAITPEMFPEDNMKLAMMVGFTADEKKAFQARVTDWEKSPHSQNETTKYGGIRYIRQLLDIPMIAKYYCPTVGPGFFTTSCFGDGQIPFMSSGSIESLTKKEKDFNPDSVQACALYRLYNSPNMIGDRKLYLLNDLLVCNNKLKSVEYDEVKIYPDDKNLTITNYTMNGHLLHPGKVQRAVIEECGSVKVVTIGTGLNYCADAVMPEQISEVQKDLFNLRYGPIYGFLAGTAVTETEKLIFKGFAKMQAKMNGNGNFIVGTILFKNIDMKLKSTFEGNK